MYDALKTIGFISVINLLRYFIVAGVFFLLFYKVLSIKFSSLKIQVRNARTKDFLREIKHCVLTCIIIGGISYIMLRTQLHDYTLIYSDIHKHSIGYWVLSVLLALLVHDSYFYWMHRLLHLPNLYKVTHAVHHRSVTPSPWTSYSFSLIEAFTEALILVPVVMLMPMHITAILFFAFGGFIINVYGHLGYEIAPKWLRNSFLFHVVNTSVYHNMHHSKFKGNYGLYFRFWDKVMGTENPEYEQEFDRVMAQKR